MGHLAGIKHELAHFGHMNDVGIELETATRERVGEAEIIRGDGGRETIGNAPCAEQIGRILELSERYRGILATRLAVIHVCGRHAQLGTLRVALREPGSIGMYPDRLVGDNRRIIPIGLLARLRVEVGDHVHLLVKTMSVGRAPARAKCAQRNLADRCHRNGKAPGVRRATERDGIVEGRAIHSTAITSLARVQDVGRIPRRIFHPYLDTDEVAAGGKLYCRGRHIGRTRRLEGARDPSCVQGAVDDVGAKHRVGRVVVHRRVSVRRFPDKQIVLS